MERGCFLNKSEREVVFWASFMDEQADTITDHRRSIGYLALSDVVDASICFVLNDVSWKSLPKVASAII
eukprot:scaffold1044_cov192-Skeletonema_marinoi.AAC.1